MSNSLASTLSSTEYAFDGQTGLYHGKVRDVYAINDKYIVMVATDRISAFDQVLPRAIPHKGQVLNQIAAYFLQASKDIAPNWLIASPDENVSIGYKCQPFPIEVVVRGMLVGHAWREYQSGKRSLCGQKMPDGMKQYDLFPEPLITPTTKASAGHDEDITAEQIVKQGLASQSQYQKICDLALKLFAKGQQMADAKGLVLADTKYEFGLLGGKIVLMDEIHTPDSSRYFYKDHSSTAPLHLSKEFVRSWLMDKGYQGKAGDKMPEMTDQVVADISGRYIELYEKITGKKFIPAKEVDIAGRIEDNINKAIKELD